MAHIHVFRLMHLCGKFHTLARFARSQFLPFYTILFSWSINLKVQIFAGTYFREDLNSWTTREKIRFRGYSFSRMGRIFVLILYFRAIIDAFWTIFDEAQCASSSGGFLIANGWKFHEIAKISTHENLYLQRILNHYFITSKFITKHIHHGNRITEPNKRQKFTLADCLLNDKVSKPDIKTSCRYQNKFSEKTARKKIIPQIC